MLHKLVKKISIGVLIVSLLFSGFDPMGFVYVFKNFSKDRDSLIVDRIYLAQQNKNVVDTFFSNNTRAHAAITATEREYVIDIGPVNGSTTANYVFASFFNPTGSGRTAAIKRIAIRSNTASSTCLLYTSRCV